MLAALCSLILVPLASGLHCEPWCSHPCHELNGDTEFECGECTEAYQCRRGMPGFGRRLAAVDASGQVHSRREESGDSSPYSFNSNGKRIRKPTEFLTEWEVGGCDLEKVHHTKVTRQMVEDAEKPFIIVGLTETWRARQNWVKETLLKRHSEQPYHLHANGNQSLGELLNWRGKYHMGHAVYPPEGCYSDPWRPYSPMLFGALGDDYKVPEYFHPMATFQMGVGTGQAIGVPPENHPASWFAAIQGRKRWVIMPPSAGSSRSGGPGTEPPEAMTRHSGRACQPSFKPADAMHCDQQEGEVLWLPSYWWHETCGLDDFSIGIGGITYKGCCEDLKFAGYDQCGGESGASYKISDIAACAASELDCGTLPVKEFA